MRRRVLGATAGAMIGAAVLAAGLVASPWRPDSLWVALGVLGVALPACTAGGAVAALAGLRVPRPLATARVAALGAPALAVFTLFAVMSVLSTREPGAQQVAALVLGGAAAGALAGRFTDDEG